MCPRTGFPIRMASHPAQQHSGTSLLAYTPTFATEDTPGFSVPVRYMSIVCQPAYRDKSYEELRWEDYQDPINLLNFLNASHRPTHAGISGLVPGLSPHPPTSEAVRLVVPQEAPATSPPVSSNGPSTFAVPVPQASFRFQPLILEWLIYYS